MPQAKVLSLHAHLDPSSEQTLIDLCEQIEEETTIDLPPEEVRHHMTVGSWEVDTLPPGEVERLSMSLATVSAVQVYLQLLLMPRVVAQLSLAPVVYPELLQWQQTVHSGLSGLGKPHRAADMPGRWRPHMSLFKCNPGDLGAICDKLKLVRFPMSAKLSRLAFVMHGWGEAPQRLAAVELAGADEEPEKPTRPAPPPPSTAAPMPTSMVGTGVYKVLGTGITVRYAEIESPDIVRLMTELDKHLKSNDRAGSTELLSLEALKQRGDTSFFLAELEGEAAGCAALRADFSNGYAEIERLYVQVKSRRKGVGSALLRELEVIAKTQGLKQVKVCTAITQKGIMEMFEKAGYQRCERFGNHFEDMLTAFVEKAL